MRKNKKDEAVPVSLAEASPKELELFLESEYQRPFTSPECFAGYQERLGKLDNTSDHITFSEVIESVRDYDLEKDLSFRVYGQEDLMKILSLGSPEYMAQTGILLLGTAFTYPQQFMERDYHPDPPEDHEDENDFYPEVSLVIELRAGSKKPGIVYWSNFLGDFPEDTYIPGDERRNFTGTWDQCIDHYVALVERMEKLAEGVLEASGMEREFH